MSDETPQADRAAGKPRPAQSTPTTTPEEQRYTREELRENARGLLNASPHAVAGALAEPRKQTFTLDEAEGLVKKFLGKKIEPPKSEGES